MALSVAHGDPLTSITRHVTKLFGDVSALYKENGQSLGAEGGRRLISGKCDRGVNNELNALVSLYSLLRKVIYTIYDEMWKMKLMTLSYYISFFQLLLSLIRLCF